MVRSILHKACLKSGSKIDISRKRGSLHPKNLVKHDHVKNSNVDAIEIIYEVMSVSPYNFNQSWSPVTARFIQNIIQFNKFHIYEYYLYFCKKFWAKVIYQQAYIEPCQASKMELFAKLLKEWKSLTIKKHHLRFWWGSECSVTSALTRSLPKGFQKKSLVMHLNKHIIRSQ